MEIVKISLTI